MLENGIDDRKRPFAAFFDVYQTLIVVPDIRVYELHALLSVVHGQGDLIGICRAKLCGVAAVVSGAAVVALAAPARIGYMSRRFRSGFSGICSRRQTYHKGNAAKRGYYGLQHRFSFRVKTMPAPGLDSYGLFIGVLIGYLL